MSNLHQFSGFELIDESGQVLAKCHTGNDLIKAHVKGYTRSDGTFVAEHDDNRQAAQAKPTASKGVKTKEVGDEVYFPHPDKPGKKAMGEVVGHTEDGKAVIRHAHSDLTFTHNHSDLKLLRSAKTKKRNGIEGTREAGEMLRQHLANMAASKE